MDYKSVLCSDMTQVDEEEQAAFKAALWLAVGKIADQTCSEDLEGVTASANFIAALTEYVWEQTQTLGRDSEAFARHRGSRTIETKDVLLCTRRNDALHELLQNDISTLR